MDPRAPAFVPRVTRYPMPVLLTPGPVFGTNILWMTPVGSHIQPPMSAQTRPLPLLYSSLPARHPTADILGAVHQSHYGHQQEGMVSSGPPPLIFRPVTSESMSVAAESAKGTLELQMMKPEAFPCGLPALDLPTPVLHPTPTPVVKQVKQTKPKSSHPKPKPKPKVPKTPKVTKKAVPESKPLFEPVPLGAKHAETKIQFFGDKVALSKRPGIYKTLHKSRPGKSGKCVTSRKGCKALVSELPLFSEKDRHLSSKRSGSGKVCKKVEARFESDSNVSDNGIEAGTVSASKISRSVTECSSGKDSVDTDAAVGKNDEYEIDYLYITKFILRKKTKPAPVAQKRKHSDEEPPSTKRTKGETHAAKRKCLHEEQTSKPSAKKQKETEEETEVPRGTKILPEVFHFEDTESLLSSDILDLF